MNVISFHLIDQVNFNKIPHTNFLAFYCFIWGLQVLIIFLSHFVEHTIAPVDSEST